MITITLLEKIEQLLPGRDDDSALRRRVVRILADAGGQLSVQEVRAALGSGGPIAAILAAAVWDALRWWDDFVSLAPWLRQELGLPAQQEGPSTAPPDGVKGLDAEGDWALAEACWGRVCLA